MPQSCQSVWFPAQSEHIVRSQQVSFFCFPGRFFPCSDRDTSRRAIDPTLIDTLSWLLALLRSHAHSGRASECGVSPRRAIRPCVHHRDHTDVDDSHPTPARHPTSSSIVPIPRNARFYRLDQASIYNHADRSTPTGIPTAWPSMRGLPRQRPCRHSNHPEDRGGYMYYSHVLSIRQVSSPRSCSETLSGSLGRDSGSA